MKISKKKTKDHLLLKLEGELTIYHAAESQESIFQDNNEWPDTLALDLHGIEELDTAGVQLLLMIEKILRERGHRIYLAKSNEHVDQVLRVLDLTQHFTLEA
jgi:anti-anti-sigma factor